MPNPIVTPIPGKPNLLLGAYGIADVGYTAEEFFVSGSASTVTSSESSDYHTRMVVLKPADDERFNGTVLVEWLNVSGGIDAPAVWFMAHREIVRAGYAYVAASVQRVGVEGGASLGFDMSLKNQNPQRYAPLHHPGDAFAFDIFSQIGRAVRDSGVLGSLRPEYVVALGESQSAVFLTTYVNAVDSHAEAYDGFLVHSRFGPAAPLDGTSIFDPSNHNDPPPARFRSDLRVPVMTIITETDLVGGHRAGYHLARQPDTDRLRTWEIPGTAHADNYTIRVAPIDTGAAPLDAIVAAYAPTKELMGQHLSYFINFAPQHHYVLQAALSGLHTWVRTARPPASVPGIALTDAHPPQFVLDANGIAQGGLRTPWVDVPTARTRGDAPVEGAMSWLFGSGEPFDAEELRRLYPGGATDYLERFTVALDDAIGAGFIVAADRQEILDIAAATFLD
ncbi:MAG TPA: alpha/beta hydrolase domain-containing protein [Mycobacterium sp.]|jgi:hypothetical protein